MWCVTDSNEAAGPDFLHSKDAGRVFSKDSLCVIPQAAALHIYSPYIHVIH